LALNKQATTALTLALLTGDWSAYLSCFSKQERLILRALGKNRLTLVQVVAKTHIGNRVCSTVLCSLGKHEVLIMHPKGVWAIAQEGLVKYLEKEN
jgi:hypothetical protein